LATTVEGYGYTFRACPGPGLSHRELVPDGHSIPFMTRPAVAARSMVS
jgi:hypothetical protein